MTTADRGFTLIEMAIVLTIIGLLLGAIIVGQEMIRSSQIQSIISDQTRYVQAISNFQTKYQALPGDFAGAEAIWGTDPSGCPAAANTTPKIPTCNGDGDGEVDNINEQFRLWQQLADAGMITGSYSGASAPGSGATGMLGVNLPASRVDGAGFMFMWIGVITGNLNGLNWDANYKHDFNFGSLYGSAPVAPYGPILTPTEAWSVDNKLDDGVPSTGKVMTVRQATFSNCSTSDVAASAQYNQTYTGLACNLYFITDF